MPPTPADMPGAQPSAGFLRDVPEVRPMPPEPSYPFPPRGAESDRRPPAISLTRDQQCRRVALDLAVKHWADLECKPCEVLDTARDWADWIRTGKVRTDAERQCDKPA